MITGIPQEPAYLATGAITYSHPGPIKASVKFCFYQFCYLSEICTIAITFKNMLYFLVTSLDNLPAEPFT